MTIHSPTKLLLMLLLLCALPGCMTAHRQVGPLDEGVHLVSTGQTIRPAGETLEMAGRPVDLALSPDAAMLYVKDNRGIAVVDARAWRVLQELSFGEDLGGSMHGIAVGPTTGKVYATTAQDRLCVATTGPSGKLEWETPVLLPGPGGEGASHPTGISLSSDGSMAYVCLSRNNTLAVVDLTLGSVVREIPVGVAPYDVVLSRDSATAYVSNWGGRHPEAGARSAPSSGTPVAVDERGVAESGTVSIVELGEGKVRVDIETGLHPSDLELDSAGDRLYVANANADSISILDVAKGTLVQEFRVKADPELAFGSAPNALALDAEEHRLYVALGGNNAIAVLDVAQDAPGILGFLSAGWYPGALCMDGASLFVANVKGLGSRTPNDRKPGWNSRNHRGTLSRVARPSASDLASGTRRVRDQSGTLAALRAFDRGLGGRRPVPVPRQVGDPSVFDHVVYIIKENRTYDQVFGDLAAGNGDPDLCVFGLKVTPNHHALAESFVLLDNFYCNGVLSADGHSWATEGNVTDHLEKSFGGFTRSYTFGDDPLTYSRSGFLWDNVLAHGLSFRNYGEMDYAEPIPSDLPFMDVYGDFISGARKVKFRQSIGIERLRQYSCPEYPGWNMGIPDVLRAQVFLDELARIEIEGDLPNLSIVYLPQDHGSGTKPGFPTPAAHVADNDLALGRIVEGISHSRFWPKTCIFVVEDDPQNGFDHVDGHRSIGLVVSPYTKRGAVVSRFYNQTSVLHTIARILGMPPMNQMDAMAPVMEACFTRKPDFRPYGAVPNSVPLDLLNRELSVLNEKERHWAELSLEQDFEHVDAADEDTLNRIIWHAMKGVDTPYPGEFAGAHGRGLAGLGLQLADLEDDA